MPDKEDIIIIIGVITFLGGIVAAVFACVYENGTSTAGSAAELETSVRIIENTILGISGDIDQTTKTVQNIDRRLYLVEYRLDQIEIKLDTILTNQAWALTTAGEESESCSILYPQSISINHPKNNTLLKNGISIVNGTSSLDSQYISNGREYIYIVANSSGRYWIYTKATPYYTSTGEWETPRPCIFTSALKLDNPLEIFAIITEEPYYFGYSTKEPLNYIAKSDSVYVYG